MLASKMLHYRLPQPNQIGHIILTQPSRLNTVLCKSVEIPELLVPLDALSSAKIIYATAAAGGHDMPGHAECAARIPAILEALETHGLVDHSGVLELTGYSLASPQDITAVHNLRYLKALERSSDNARDVANLIVDPAPTYVTATSAKDALKAAGAAMALVDHVVAASNSSNDPAATPAAFAICRPPGHHAVPTNGMGFCLLNNAAVAAKHAQQAHGLQRVAIFDFDVHHGNGTQDAFYNDPSVLFISTHQYGSYPYTGKLADVGQGDGEGSTMNIPLPGDSGHSAAIAAFEDIVGPAIKKFNPDIILVSAGYDAHWKDPLAGLQYRSSTYHELASRVKSLANEICGGRVVFLLEGGYDLDALGESVASTFAGVIGDKAIELIDPGYLRDEPMEKVKAVLEESRRIHGL